jgi:hypothetical protein
LNKIRLKYIATTLFSKAYWQYALFSKTGLESIFSIFGAIYLIVEALDFFQMYSRAKYSSFAFLFFLLLSIIISAIIRRPIESITMKFQNNDYQIVVRIVDLFEVNAAIMISSNTVFEADVAGGKINPDSLQGQFTAKYYTGNQSLLIRSLSEGISSIGRSIPCEMGTTIPISTHGKTFYFVAMAELSERGNASTSVDNIRKALDGLWNYVRDSGDLQELAVPVIGTGRGRVQTNRKKMIALIAESFAKASAEKKVADKLIIAIRPNDAFRFGVNLYDIKDNLSQILYS